MSCPACGSGFGAGMTVAGVRIRRAIGVYLDVAHVGHRQERSRIQIGDRSAEGLPARRACRGA